MSEFAASLGLGTNNNNKASSVGQSFLTRHMAQSRPNVAMGNAGFKPTSSLESFLNSRSGELQRYAPSDFASSLAKASRTRKAGGAASAFEDMIGLLKKQVDSRSPQFAQLAGANRTVGWQD